MIQRRFTEPHHWERWLVLSRRWPEQSQELEARVQLILTGIQDTVDQGDPVLRALERADLAMSEAIRVDGHGPPRWSSVLGPLTGFIAVAVVLLAIAVGVYNRSPEGEDVVWRGEAGVALSEVWLERDGVGLGAVSIGSGLRPTIPAGGQVRVGSTVPVVAWVVGSPGVHDLTTGWETSPQPGDVWVLAELDGGVDPHEVAELVGRGDTLVEGLSGGRFAFVEWVP